MLYLLVTGHTGLNAILAKFWLGDAAVSVSESVSIFCSSSIFPCFLFFFPHVLVIPFASDFFFISSLPIQILLKQHLFCVRSNRFAFVNNPLG